MISSPVSHANAAVPIASVCRSSAAAATSTTKAVVNLVVAALFYLPRPSAGASAGNVRVANA